MGSVEHNNHNILGNGEKSPTGERLQFFFSRVSCKVPQKRPPSHRSSNKTQCCVAAAMCLHPIFDGERPGVRHQPHQSPRAHWPTRSSGARRHGHHGPQQDLKPCNPYVGEMSLTTRTQEYMPPKKHPKTLLWISLSHFSYPQLLWGMF